MNSIRRFFSELRRRKVLRVGTAYALVAWVVLQVAEVTFEPLHLPDWTLTLFVALVIAGFPLALVLAWALELTPQGLQPERVAPDTAGDRPETGTPRAQPDAGRSVAVLPFSDLSPEQDQGYFCEGIVEEIINTLTRVEGLHVASRTSTLQYRTRTADIRTIGAELGVSTVLEGTVRRQGDQLRVTAQLINAADGYHLWSQRFDREMCDIFQIQDEIAGNIAGAMQLSLKPKDRCAAQASSTHDPRAYDFYLRGWSLHHRWGRRNLLAALEMFRRSAEVDPEYARAWAGLADTYAALYIWIDSSPEHREKAREASERAVSICPKLAEAQVSRGVAAAMFRNWAEAEARFEQAISLDPQLFEAWYFYARTSIHQGKIERAAELFERASEVKPDDYQTPLLLSQLYEQLGDDDKSLAAARRGVDAARRQLEVYPDDVRAMYLSSGPLVKLGEPDRARALVQQALELDPEDTAVVYNAACFNARFGDSERALDMLESIPLASMAVDWIERDPDLTSLHGHPRFEALRERLSDRPPPVAAAIGEEDLPHH